MKGQARLKMERDVYLRIQLQFHDFTSSYIHADRQFSSLHKLLQISCASQDPSTEPINMHATRHRIV